MSLFHTFGNQVQVLPVVTHLSLGHFERGLIHPFPIDEGAEDYLIIHFLQSHLEDRGQLETRRIPGSSHRVDDRNLFRNREEVPEEDRLVPLVGFFMGPTEISDDLHIVDVVWILELAELSEESFYSFLSNLIFNYIAIKVSLQQRQ